MKRVYIYSALIAIVATVSTHTAIRLVEPEKDTAVKIEHINSLPSQNVLYSMNENKEVVPLDFTETASKVIDGVVHIKSTQITSSNRAPQQQQMPDIFREFFGPQFRFESPQGRQSRPTPRVGSGSGVIISKEGYIVTNNHVIDNADDIEVTLHDNRTYKASIVGTDPTTDIAVLQIREDDLPTVPFVDSDNVKIGQWVMAVGNPFSLNSTVTAGIVSAKGRNINILKEQYAVEDFIQTDAAINPGNSGGALVNLNGGLIGINTAIASPTGAYSGYGFAVPSNIVNKVVEDLITYGVVQRGVLGITIRTVDANLAKEKELEVSQGVYVDSLLANGAAEKAGLKAGDVITQIDGIEVETSPELQGLIARKRPGENVNIKVLRDEKEKSFNVTLKNREGNTAFVSTDKREIVKILGADFEEIDKKLANKLAIETGIKVTKLYAGKLRRQTQMQEGFIITKVDGKSVKNVDDLLEKLENKKGGVLLEGVYEDLPGKQFYGFGLD